MKKNKIATKLTLYFSTTLVVFSLVIGFTFMTLFTNHVTNQHKDDLKKRALNISNKLSSFITYNQKDHLMMPGYGGFFKFLDDIAMTDVWIVDKDMNIITSNCDQVNIKYKDLPSGADKVIKEVFNDTISFSESFSDVLNTKAITVGTPVKDINGQVVATVLLHSPTKDISSIILNCLKILLISILIALILAILIATALSISFTKPLNKMKNVAIKLSKKEYDVKTDIDQNDEIGELANTIDMLCEKLYLSSKENEKLEKMRKDFISNISHELRTPVTVIRGSLEALCDGIINDSEKVSEYHSQMLSESIHLQRLVNDLLDISKLQNSDFELKMSSLNLIDILNSSIRSMRPIANKKGISFIVNNNINIYNIYGDYDRLQQMLSIILDNAIKFSPLDKNIYINVSNNNELELSILDEGCGIDPEDIPYIFDRFHKSSSKDNINGTGLGLSIAKQIADRHNIKVHVESEVNKYTKFTLFIKAHQ